MINVDHKMWCALPWEPITFRRFLMMFSCTLTDVLKCSCTEIKCEQNISWVRFRGALTQSDHDFFRRPSLNSYWLGENTSSPKEGGDPYAAARVFNKVSCFSRSRARCCQYHAQTTQSRHLHIKVAAITQRENTQN